MSPRSGAMRFLGGMRVGRRKARTEGKTECSTGPHGYEGIVAGN